MQGKQLCFAKQEVHYYYYYYHAVYRKYPRRSCAVYIRARLVEFVHLMFSNGKARVACI